MKLISSLAIALVAAEEKKVPPRHPLNRLNTLRGFFAKFAEDVVVPITGNQNYADRLTKRMQGMTDSMEKAFNRPNCGYYDESSKHGGPDPEPHLRPNGKPRNRRDTEDETHFDDQEEFEAACALGWENNNVQVRTECCQQIDSYYSANESGCNMLPRRKGGNKKTPWDRLSADPALKWKQIMTGCRKWAERYINNCAGQRKNKLIKNRTKRVFEKVNTKLGL